MDICSIVGCMVLSLSLDQCIQRCVYIYMYMYGNLRLCVQEHHIHVYSPIPFFIKKIRGACGQRFVYVYMYACVYAMMQCGIAQLVQSVGYVHALRPDYIIVCTCRRCMI